MLHPNLGGTAFLYYMQLDPANFTSMLIQYVELLPDSVFEKNPAQRRNAMVDQLEAVESCFETGNVDGGREHMENTLLSKVDGERGGNPANDWLVSSPEKDQLYLTLVWFVFVLNSPDLSWVGDMLEEM